MSDFPDLLTPWCEWKKRQWKNFPVRTNRASALGGDCERQLTYMRTSWDQAEPVDFGSQVVMSEGSKHEEYVLDELRKSGITILEQQASLEWTEYQITGHIDAVVLYEETSDSGCTHSTGIPLDIKSMAPWIWDSCFRRGATSYLWNEVKDSFDKRPWLRKYLAQISLYMLLKNVERGILVCINKSTGALAQVNVDLDYEYSEELLKRAERINAHVDHKTLPDRIKYDFDICPRCPFYTICLPDQQGKDPLLFIDDQEVEGWLNSMTLRKKDAQDYEKLDAKLKDWAKARSEDSWVVGDWLVTKKTARNGAVRVTTQYLPAASSDAIG